MTESQAINGIYSAYLSPRFSQNRGLLLSSRSLKSGAQVFYSVSLRKSLGDTHTQLLRLMNDILLKSTG